MTTEDPVALALARSVHGLRGADLPPEVTARAAHLMLDAIGCALAARREPYSTHFWAATSALCAGTTGNSGVIGYAQRLPLRDATLLNGALMHGLDYDDTHIAGVVHLTVSVLPALLNLAAQRGLSGGDVLLAYVAGVEAGARLAMAARGGFHTQGFHPTAMVGTFAAAFAVGRLLQLDVAQLVHAQGLALSMASGSLQFLEDGSWTKRLHAGWAAQAGLTAALMAAAGVVAPTAPHTGRHGLFSLFLGAEGRAAVDLGLATHDLPGACLSPAWEVHGIAIKPYAMCHFVHAATDAAIALHRQGVDLQVVQDIEVLVPQAAVPLVCEPLARKRRPGNDYEAKFSLPYAVVCGLLRGRLDLQDLQPAAYQSAQVQALMDRVRYSVDPDATFPRHYSGEVRLTMADGSARRHREAVNRGHAERPLSNADVQHKFSANAALHFSRRWADGVMAQVLDLQDLPQVQALEDRLAQEP